VIAGIILNEESHPSKDGFLVLGPIFSLGRGHLDGLHHVAWCPHRRSRVVDYDRRDSSQVLISSASRDRITFSCHQNSPRMKQTAAFSSPSSKARLIGLVSLLEPIRSQRLLMHCIWNLSGYYALFTVYSHPSPRTLEAPYILKAHQEVKCRNLPQRLLQRC
jgi:hypothetical protein